MILLAWKVSHSNAATVAMITKKTSTIHLILQIYFVFQCGRFVHTLQLVYTDVQDVVSRQHNK